METSPDILIDQLAEDIANHITNGLEAASISRPLVIIDLSYHYADWYFPMVSFLTIEELEQETVSGSFSLYDHRGKALLLASTPSALDGQMDQLMQLEWNDDMLDIGRTMIRKTAAILNKTKLWGRVATHDLFGAFAVDGTVEGHSPEEWEKILTGCGVDGKLQAAWRHLGFF